MVKKTSSRVQHTVYLNLQEDADMIAALDHLSTVKFVSVSHYLRSALREKLLREKLIPAKNNNQKK